jgi:hypothetical protein
MEKNRKRSERRYSESVIQRRRFKKTRWINEIWPDTKHSNPRVWGKLRHNHRGCGCSMCKPWNLTGVIPLSTARQLQDSIEDILNEAT